MAVRHRGVAMFEPVAGGFDVEWLSAGHPAPIVLCRDRPARRGEGGGVPLGILSRPRFGRSGMHLRPGDTLVIFTDGLTESRDPHRRMFEDHALGATLDRLRKVPVDTLVTELSRSAVAFGDSGADDIAVLAIHVEEAPE